MGKKIYIVGGAVRDKLLKIENDDIDYVAVGYTPKDFAHLEQVGKDFPVFLQKDGSQIALARVEKKISQGYNGFETITSNVTLQDDLKRRDLTINSIAYDPKTKFHYDPYNGIDDIKNKILKHTSKAFVEDPLRVLRLARFKAKFPQFTIDNSTKQLVKTMKKELKTLQKDRVYKEIKKVFELKNSEIFFQTLLELNLLEDIFPNIYNLTLLRSNNIDLFQNSMFVLQNLSNQNELLKFTALYHNIAIPYRSKKIGYKPSQNDYNIKFVEPLIDIQISKKTKKEMLLLIQNHIKLLNLKTENSENIASFFQSYNKNRELFINQIVFVEAKIKTLPKSSSQQLEKDKLLYIFDTISSYSPKKWIEQQKLKKSVQNVSGEQIKQHIHHHNIAVINKLWYNGKK